VALTAEFIDGASGRILVTVHQPRRDAGIAIVVLPAFGEEMNKSRRLVWEAATLLAEKGYLVAVPDLFGTGDSEGDFVDASWNDWVLDIKSVIDWLIARKITAVSALAVRFGATLLESTGRFIEFDQVVAWQPVGTGIDVLRELIRTKRLNMRMAGLAPPSAEEMIDCLCNGDEPMEFSGYSISPQLARMIRSAEFNQDQLRVRGRSIVVTFGKAGDAQSAVLNNHSCDETKHSIVSVGGERFWRTLEPGRNPELITTTVNFFRRK